MNRKKIKEKNDEHNRKKSNEKKDTMLKIKTKKI